MFSLLATVVLGLQVASVDLQPDQDPGNVLSAVYVHVDPNGTMGVNEALARGEHFVRNTSGFVNPGTTSGVVWIRFNVRNTGTHGGTWIMSLNRALVDPGEIFMVSDQGGRRHVETLLADSTRAYADSYREFGTLAGRFSLRPGETATLFARYRGGNWSGLIPSITTARTLQRAVTYDLVVTFAIIGGVLTLVLYTAVSFLLLDRQIVFLYAMAQSSLLAFYVHFCGFTTVYLWPLHPEAGRAVAPVTLFLSIAAMLQFARRFFDARSHLPGVDRLLLVLLVSASAAIVMAPLDHFIPGFPRQLPLYLGYLVVVLGWFVLAPLALHATFRWDRDYWPMAVSWSAMAGFMLPIQLVWTGVVDSMPLNEHVYGVIVYVEAVFLALGIALRIRRMRRERMETERQLSASLAAELAATQRARRLAEEREWALADLAEKGQLALAAGHDTRQMISSLRHYAFSLERDSDVTRHSRVGPALTQIANSLDEVLATAISGSASGGIGDRTVALEPLSPEQILDPLKLIHGGMALQKGLELRFRARRSVLVTDRVLVSRIVSNLLSNALKYTDHGRVLVACRPFRGGWRLQVFDSGHGIDQAALKELLDSSVPGMRFEPQTDGYGAGLHIARSLAARLGGTLDAGSIAGRGSRFELRLPGPGVPPSAGLVMVLDSDPQHAGMCRQASAATPLRMLQVDSPDRVPDWLPSEQALVLVDEHFGGNHAGLALARKLSHASPSSTIAIMTYDRSIDARRRASEVTELMLYKPVSAELLMAAARRARLG